MTVFVALIWPVGWASATPSTEEDVGVGLWQLHDASATSMSVQGIGGPGKTSTALVAVTQRFCDAVTDQAVFRTIFAQADVDPGEFVVQPRLDQARLATTVTARVVDNRLASCAAPIGTPTTVDQPDARVTVDIDWKATGPLVTVQPDVVSGAAAATGSVKSTALNGAPRLLLGSSLFAELLRRSVP